MSETPELWLSLDLSSQSGSLAVHEHSGATLRVLAEVTLQDGGKHSESVLPGLDQVLAKAGTSLSLIDRYLTTTGPGSFTGLRIAFSALKAFHLANSKPIETLAAHEARALAYLKNTAEKPKALWVSTQITRDSFLLTEFQFLNGALVKIGDTTVPELAKDRFSDLSLLTDKPAEVGIHFPLQARHLAECLEQAQSRETLSTATAVAAASPHYFGSKNY
jgi:tRNA threonylcarbamoyl adenosine modification protein YeaZ